MQKMVVRGSSTSGACAPNAGRRGAAVKELEGETHVSVRRVCCYGVYTAHREGCLQGSRLSRGFDDDAVNGRWRERSHACHAYARDIGGLLERESLKRVDHPCQSARWRCDGAPAPRDLVTRCGSPLLLAARKPIYPKYRSWHSHPVPRLRTHWPSRRRGATSRTT